MLEKEDLKFLLVIQSAMNVFEWRKQQLMRGMAGGWRLGRRSKAV
jgi:hypothetical protein